MFWKTFREDASLAKGRSAKSLGWGILSTLSYFAAYGYSIYETVLGRITLGKMTLYTTLFSQSQGAFNGMLDNLGNFYENGLFLNNLFDFLGLESRVEVLDSRTRPAEDPHRGLEFKNVWFRYPGSSEWALENVSLSILPAEKIALVGPNGSGKTTLIKLLARLYEPTSGEILYRGVNLKYFPPEELHRRIGAIFQDFVRYHMTLRENIGFGSVEDMGDLARIEDAARQSGADAVVPSLPRGYDSILGRWFDTGVELSGGQWQKIAIARSFMSRGDILVLDEPTASLDAEAECEIFKRFRDLARLKISILVSHRFSTARLADRIAVLRGGRLVELGSHDELVARRGTYAELFEIQAQGYR